MRACALAALSGERDFLHRCCAMLVAMVLFVSLANAVEIPVVDFARAPQYAMPALSPDGASLIYVRHVNHHDELIIRDLREQIERRALRIDARREQIGWCDWADGQYVLCGTRAASRRPDAVVETTRLYSLNTRTDQLVELNRWLDNAVRDHVIGIRRSPDGLQALVQRDARGVGFPEVWALEIATGVARREQVSHPPIRRWMADQNGRVRLGIAYDAEHVELYTHHADADDWRVFAKRQMASLDALAPLAIGKNTLYALKHHRGRAALFRMDLDKASSPPVLVFADDQFDITGPVVLNEHGELLGIHLTRESREFEALDDDEQGLRTWLAEALEAQAVVLDRSTDGRWLLVESGSDIDPPSLHLADAKQRTLIHIADGYPSLESVDLAAMRYVTYPARDGQTIPAYLTLPQVRSDQPQAFVVMPHGGPESRVWRRFDSLVQMLASRGIGVLQMNFRGSLGYGTRFAAAGAAQWGGVIHNDITDGARWLIEQRYADPTRLCIVGASFGGYAAMLGAVRESQWYACAVSYGGIADLLAYSQHISRFNDVRIWRARLGEDRLALWQMSPIARVQSTQTPLLLIHGLLDGLVPASQSRRFARALRKAGKPHELSLRGDCDHEMTLESCRVSAYTEIDRFVMEQIGATSRSE